MSERSISPPNYFELKHVKCIVQKQQSNLTKRRTMLCQSREIINSERNQCNLSCDCSECGQLIGFQLNIRQTVPLLETRYQKRRRVLRKFKAVGNAILFVLAYKVEAIKRLKKKMHLLRAVRNLTVRRPAMLSSVHMLPSVQPIIIKQPLTYMQNYISHEEEVDDTVTIQAFQNCQVLTRKSQISQYMEKMLKDVIPKKEPNLKPLSILNNALNKSTKQFHIKSRSQISLTHCHYQTQLTPYCELNRTSTNNNSLYHHNNKDLLKLIDIMKVKHRVIRAKKLQN